MKSLAILGSTGSIGRNTLKIVEMFPERFSVKALAAGLNTDLLCSQIRQFSPDIAVVLNDDAARELREKLGGDSHTDILSGPQGYEIAAAYPDVDMVVSAIVGAAGLLPTLAAIEAKKQVALANKETLVMAGEIVMQRAAEQGIAILPVDSEHSAVFQCISGQRVQDISKIILTASGGPFRNKPAGEFAAITLKDALNHPTWEMGQKISIDSATLMNKGLEVIEAKFLFDLPLDKIDVVVHPQSLVHSMVSYVDGSVIAQMGVPDMKGAISYAMGYPERLPLNQAPPEFTDIGSLTFEPPDLKKFPCLAMAYHACRQGSTFPCVLNAANEVAVNAFLNQRITFVDIPEVIDRVMDMHQATSHPDLADILGADAWARNEGEKVIQRKF